MMSIMDALELGNREVISFVGGGGKTTLISILSKELKQRGKKPLVTTTTHMYPEGSMIVDCDEGRLEDILSLLPDYIFPLLAGREIDREGKLRGISPSFVDSLSLSGSFPYILVEADGSKGKPVKAFASHEPSVPSCTTLYIAVAGLDYLGKPLKEDYAHRPHIIEGITGMPCGSLMDEDLLVKLFKGNEGLLKGRREGARAIVVLNKADSEKLISSGELIGIGILNECKQVSKVLLCSRDNEKTVLKVLER